MPYSQIRINKTKDMQKVLDALKNRFKLLSEAEIVKMLLSEAYFRYSTPEVSLVEMSEDEVSDDIKAKAEQAKNTDKSEFLDI